jgi:hypothetical protein
MISAKETLRSVRIMHGVFLLAAIGYVVVPLGLMRVESLTPPAVLAAAFGFTAATVLGLAVFLRTRLVQASGEALRNNPEDAVALQQWRKGTIVSYMLCESVVIFGMALRITGVSRNICGIFYAVGILFLLAWTPKLDLPPE